MTSAARQRATDYYDAHAAELAVRYGSVTFENVHARMRPYLPDPPAVVMDVGAGSGRDAIALTRLGYEVVAVEPAAALRGFGEAATSQHDVRWISDHLPDLAVIAAERRRFDFVLASAVLMHLDATELGAAFATIRDVLASGGRAALTVRSRAVDEPRALFHEHGRDALLGRAAEAGFALLHEWVDGDVLQRDRSWHGYVLERL